MLSVPLFWPFALFFGFSVFRFSPAELLMIMTSRSGDIHSLHDSDAGSDIDVRTDDDDDGK